MLQGYVDKAEGYIAGWAFDPEQPSRSVDLGIYVAGKHIADVRADQPRPDLNILGTGFTDYGFYFRPSFPLHPRDVVFARHGDHFITQTPSATEHHLSTRLNHPWLSEKGVLNIDIKYRGAQTGNLSRISERIASYLRAATRDAEKYGPLWGHLMTSRHRDLVEMSERGDALAVADYMAEIGRRDLAFGFFDGPDAHRAAGADPDFRRAAAIVIVDRIISLAEALGCRCVANPEQGHILRDQKIDLETIVADIANVCDVTTLEAPIGGYWGVSTSFGTLNARMVDALYFAYRIKSILEAYRLSGVVEIGGGAGLVAYYATRFGVGRYSIVDLPTVGAVQAFTMRNENDLFLYGEKRDANGCMLIPACHFSSLEIGGNDLLFNADSLPEIDTDAANAYLSGSLEKRFCYLLSSNHEDGNFVDNWQQNRVFDMAKTTPGFSLLSRNRNWMRPGYVEELFRIDP